MAKTKLVSRTASADLAKVTPEPLQRQAFWAMVMAVIGVTVIPLVPSAIAVWMSGRARRGIVAAGTPEGRDLVVFSRLLGWVGIIGTLAAAIVLGALYLFAPETLSDLYNALT